MNATFERLVQNVPFTLLPPTKQSAESDRVESLPWYFEEEQGFFRGIAYALLFQVAGAALALALWKLA